MTRDIGRLGESFFETLCNEVGLKSNKSISNDTTGWDFVVEFPDEKKPVGVLSSLESDFSKTICKIQIKSSDKKPRKHNIRLSNMKRFSNEVTPSFFVFFEFNKKNAPQRMFLVHTGEELIGKTLKRLREGDIKKESKINLKTMTVSYGEEHELKPISGAVLKEALLKYIGTNSHNYVKQKMDIINNIGFDQARFSVTFRTKGEDNIESMVNSLLGLKTYTDVENVKISEIRFGLEKSMSDVSEGRITIGPSASPEKINLVCLGENRDEISRIEADLFSPGMILPVIPDKLKKIRIISTYVEYVMNIHTYEAKMRLKLPNDTETIELFECYEQMNFFFKCLETQQIGIERAAEEGVHQISFNITDSDLGNDLTETYTLLGYACEALKANNILKCNCSLRYLELQKLPLLIFSHARKPIRDTTISTTLHERNAFKDLNNVAIVFKYILNFNEWNLATAIAFAGKATLEVINKKDKITFAESILISQHTLKKKSKITPDLLIPLENKVKEELEAKNFDYILQQNK